MELYDWCERPVVVHTILLYITFCNQTQCLARNTSFHLGIASIPPYTDGVLSKLQDNVDPCVVTLDGIQLFF